MKKYSRNRKNHKKSVRGTQENSSDKDPVEDLYSGGDGNQIEDTEKVIYSEKETQTQLEHHNDSSSNNLTDNDDIEQDSKVDEKSCSPVALSLKPRCITPVRHNNRSPYSRSPQYREDPPSHSAFGDSSIQSDPGIKLPLNCVWGNGIQFQPVGMDKNTTAASAIQFSSAPTMPTAPPPLINLTNYNSHLPFPDKSGTMTNSFSPFGMQNSLLPAPAPTLNASLGYPSVYVSPSGLITVLLKYDIAIEMTVDRNLRVVNHRHKTVAATNSRGSTNCVYHIAAKVFQDGTKTEVEVFGERRSRMQTNGILFASGLEVYLLDDTHIIPSQFVFNDMSKDSSVSVLYTPGTLFSNDLLVHCDEVTRNSRYYFHKNGSTTIIINNIKIHQDENGEVQVTSGPRYISTSPVYGSIHLQTHFVEISVQVWDCILGSKFLNF